MNPFNKGEITETRKNLETKLKESELGKKAEKPNRDIEIEVNLPVWLGGGGVRYRNEAHDNPDVRRSHS